MPQDICMTDSSHEDRPQQSESAWSAVVSLALGVFSLVMSEFLPASLLTPMAHSLQVSEGQAGQAVTVTALVALVAGLLVTSATRGLDRRYVLQAFSIILIAANLIVYFSPGLGWLLFGRVLLGVALGGFWALSVATAMRLVREQDVPRALSLIFTGVPIATISAAALGSFLGDMLGWRNVFLIATGLAVMTLVVQVLTLPSMPPQRPTPLRTLVDVLARPGIGMGIFAAMLVFCGHFAFFTYVRPFLEQISGAGIQNISATLLAFGLANFTGTLLAGRWLEHHLRLTLLTMPLTMGIIAWLLVTLGGFSLWTDALMITLWGLAFGAVPVAWSTWLTRVVADEAESAGGLLGASIQLSIAAGAAVGGVLFDAQGVLGTFAFSGTLLLLVAFLIATRVRTQPVPPVGHTDGIHP